MSPGECGVSGNTVKEYYQILVDTLLGRFLPAFTQRPKRWVIQSPQFYFADVGVVPTEAPLPRRLSFPTPEVREMALGREVEVEWTSTDGKAAGGVRTYPVGYEEGTRYPLVVSIHGGPASADVLRFNTTAQVYAGAGYAVLRPNYRGSTNYGNAHRTDIVGDYFTLGFDDIMTGVDHLISEGIVDGDRMGAFGWSAGGH